MTAYICPRFPACEWKVGRTKEGRPGVALDVGPFIAQVVNQPGGLNSTAIITKAVGYAHAYHGPGFAKVAGGRQWCLTWLRNHVAEIEEYADGKQGQA